MSLPLNIAKRIVESPGGCWIFTGAKQSRGYGSVGIGNKRTALAHRVAYEALVGPVPEGMTIDHLCEVKACVNPAHLEVVTAAENLRRYFVNRGTCACDACIACRLRAEKRARLRDWRSRHRLASTEARAS